MNRTLVLGFGDRCTTTVLTPCLPARMGSNHQFRERPDTGSTAPADFIHFVYERAMQVTVCGQRTRDPTSCMRRPMTPDDASRASTT